MARFKMTIEYDGTRYSGWQVQSNARTVQGELLGAIAEALGTRTFEFVGSGRTDAGVHALAQVAHLEANTTVRPDVLRIRLNDHLPSDVCVVSVEPVHARFHARHHALERAYLYQIAQRRTAFGKRFVWWVKDTLDIERMAEACSTFEGFHDFRSFTKDDPDEKSTTVELLECGLYPTDDLILIRIRGSHFLWRMVRQMVGTIVEAGRGNLTSREIQQFHSAGSSFPASVTAPPSGLFLDYVLYSKDEEPPPVQPTIRL